MPRRLHKNKKCSTELKLKAVQSYFNGELFEYDDLGKLLSYKDNEVSWSFGKRLTGYGTNTFDYDAEGKRTQKNDIKFFYDVNGRLFTQSNGIEYFYDTNSLPIAFAYNGEVYYYKKDLLGNVIEILDTTDTTVVKYVYDAWGNHTVTDYTDFNLGSVNPIRYRSYYFDIETGLYFLQSRYYDPQTGRFISMDDISYLDPETIGGVNLYAYCLNNPIKYIDLSGHKHEWIGWLISGLEIALGIALIITGVGVGAGLTLVGTGVGSIINSAINVGNGGTFWGGWTGGQAGLLMLIPGVGSVASAFIGSVVTDCIDLGWNNVDWEKATYTSLIAGVFNILPSMLSKFLDKNSINNLVFNVITLYDTLLVSTANSIVNVFWRG